ncbi:MAG: pirin family protein, partial [Elusimicrobia bacterium]|nr:pirin family protein [Elusimicrobiota bacterium]
MNRTIDRIFRGAPEHWVGDGFHVSNYFPSATDFEKRMSPFFLLDYQKPELYSPTSKKRGVGTHPHRGFETVTLAYQGSVAHRDSAGNGGVIRPDEVQWMTAGQGILHNEYHEETFARAGGVMHMIQIWVNLPRKHKLAAPNYQALEKAVIPETPLARGQGSVRVVAGDWGATQGAAKTFSPVHMLDLRLEAGAKVRLPTPKDFNTAALVLGGTVAANGSRAVTEGEFILFKNDGDEVNLEARSKAVVMFLSGAPIEEPLVHYGPFVMNSVDEINQAIEDFHHGKFGR